MGNKNEPKNIPVGDKELYIPFNAAGMVELGSIELRDKNGKPKKIIGRSSGSIGSLRLGNENARIRADMIGIAEDTVLVTHHNPTCYWYFMGGEWYRICI